MENSICKSEAIHRCSVNMALVITIIYLHIVLGLSWQLHEEEEVLILLLPSYQRSHMDTKVFVLNMCCSQAMPKFCPQCLNLRISVPQVYSLTRDYSQYCNVF